MKRTTLLFLFVLVLGALKVAAQPTFSFSPQQVVADEGELVCLDLRVEDFTDILGIRFSINFDPGVVMYQSIQNLNPNVTGLDLADFDTNQSGMGIITFDWSNGQPCMGAISGVTLPDDAILFTICFLATGEYGNHTWVDITDDPVEGYVTRLNANCNDIGEFIEPGYISVGTPPLQVNISSGDGFNGDVVCLDFDIENFDSILSFQSSIRWDSTVLSFQSVEPMNLPNFNQGNFGFEFVSSGILTVSWNTFATVGETIPDGTQIMQVCFNIIGDCGQASQVLMSDDPAPIEVVNYTAGEVGGNDIGLLQQEGTVTVNCFDINSINVDIEDKEVCPGETFTIDVTVSNFDDIGKLQFNLKYNENVITLVNPKVSFPQTGGCFGFNTGSVNVATPGLVKVNWNSTGLGCSLPDNFILFRLHFQAVGPVGSNSTISVVNPILVDKWGGLVEDIGINNNNGLVNICNINSPTLVVASMNANPGDTICLPVTVKDFEEITRLEYTLSWEYNTLRFLNVQNLNMSGLTQANFNTAQAVSLGIIGFEWLDNNGLDIPDQTVIFELCFRVLGDPGDCASVIFADQPFPIQVETITSNNTDVGLNGQPGTVCVENPLSFEVILPDVITGPGNHVCLDVDVNSFIQLTQMQYTLAWDPAILQFDTVLSTPNLPSFGPASYDDSPFFVDDGQLPINWMAPNQILGASVPDGETAFQLCFNVIGNPGDCSSIFVVPSPPATINVTSATTADANLGLTANDGSVCISAVLTLVDAVVTDVDCPDQATGAIDITVSGGSGTYSYNWTGNGVNPTSEDQSGLLPGTYNVTVTDVSNPGLFLNLEYEVGYSANATIANAGADTTFACGNFFLTLNGGGSSTGPDITYLWQPSVGGGLVLPGQETSQFPQVIGGQCYQLTVTNLSTGCVAVDEVCIAAPQKPVAIAGPTPAPQLDCTQDTVELDGSFSSFGFQYIWTTNTGQFVPGTETLLTPKVTAEGWYYLTLSNPQTGCTDTDSVFVENNKVFPTADGGPDSELGCNDNSVILKGTMVSTGPEFTYQWSAIAGGEVCGAANLDSVQVCSPGMYQLLVTDTTNGCTALDTVLVAGDTLKPVIDAGLDTALTCLVSSIQLQGVITAGSGDYTINWQDGGGNIVSGQGTLEPVVDAPATYTLEVTDNSNGCMAFSEVIVDADVDAPDVSASADGAISCADPDAVLTYTGSTTGSNIVHNWYDEAATLVASNTTTTVTIPGTYKLVVENLQNGCKDSVEVVVEDLTIPPVIDAGDTSSITCIVDEPTLNGSVDPGNQNLIIQWSGPVGNCIQNGNSPTPTVACTGMYIMTVLDTLTGCVAKDTTFVTDDMTPPGAEAGPADTLTCAVTEVTLQGSSTAGNVNVSWESVPVGLPIMNPDTFTPTVTQPGTYAMTVVSLDNGCSSSDLVTIAIDNAPPLADAGVNDTTDCVSTLGTIDASGSELTNTEITWTALSGSIDPGDIHNTVVNVGAGVYELTVVSLANGCEAKDTVSVIENGDLPTVVAADQVPFGCLDETVQLDGTGSETGPNIIYSWTDASGALIGNNLIETVDTTGAFTLTVFDNSNGCADSITIEVVAVIDGEPATAMADGDPCSTEAMLLGNQPNGTTGIWTTLTGAIIEDPNAATTLATNLGSGDNVFTWTLSLGHCENYSSASVTVSVDQASVAANFDQVTIVPAVEDSITLNLLQNDVFGSEGVTFSLVDPNTPIGGLTVDDKGLMTYVKPKCFAGTVEFDYFICSVGCPDICDTTTVRIIVENDDSEDCSDVANGITPNGDGVNDALIFDVLLNNPNEYPNNEIIIFNRWGDVVYQARPYQNDWRGTNNSGQDLPQGTYYYILKLNIAESEIIRGDITILR
ncbi:MAG: hypothetical protein Kow0027_08010 [Saprospiraceae bacterium]